MYGLNLYYSIPIIQGRPQRYIRGPQSSSTQAQNLPTHKEPELRSVRQCLKHISTMASSSHHLIFPWGVSTQPLSPPVHPSSSLQSGLFCHPAASFLLCPPLCHLTAATVERTAVFSYQGSPPPLTSQNPLPILISLFKGPARVLSALLHPFSTS